jgi:hypothetical protein
MDDGGLAFVIGPLVATRIIGPAATAPPNAIEAPTNVRRFS